MSKKIKLFGLIFAIAILVVGGFFWWRNYNDRKIGEMLAKEFFNFHLGVLPKGFVVNETLGTKILENKDIGVSFEIPTGWSFIGYMDDYIDLKSPDYKTDPETLVRIDGCLITVNVSYYSLFSSSNFIYRIAEIRDGNANSEPGEIVKIGGKEALKLVNQNEWLSKEGIKETIEVGVPLADYIAEVKFSTKIFENNLKCVNELDDFLEKVSIK